MILVDKMSNQGGQSQGGLCKQGGLACLAQSAPQKRTNRERKQETKPREAKEEQGAISASSGTWHACLPQSSVEPKDLGALDHQMGSTGQKELWTELFRPVLCWPGIYASASLGVTEEQAEQKEGRKSKRKASETENWEG